MDQFPSSHISNRTTGITVIVAFGTMLIGAILFGATGVDLWDALKTGTMPDFLTRIQDVHTLSVANLTIWILGVFLFGIAGSRLAGRPGNKPGPTNIARISYQTAVPLVILSYLCMLSLTVIVAPKYGTEGVMLGETIGWIGARADDIGTFLILGVGPLCFSLAGKGTWMPGWLANWGYLAFLAGVISVLSLFLPVPSLLGFLILPFGMGWMLAMGIVLLKK